MVEVFRPKQERLLHSFKKEKSPRPDGIPIEFFSQFLNILGDDLLSIVDYSRSIILILAPFNSTCITLIPKIDSVNYFEQFRIIFLCNTI